MKRFRPSSSVRLADSDNSVLCRAGPGCETFVIWPHRSLPPIGVLALMTSVAMGFAYAMMASKGYQFWPVIAPCALTFVGLGVAIWRNNCAASAHEIIEVSRRIVRVTRVGAAGGAPIAFNPFWMKLGVSSDRYVEDRITLSEGRQRMTIGDFLSPSERRRLADALRTSIEKQTPASAY